MLTGSDFLLVVVAVMAGNCLSRAIDWLIIEDELHRLRAELARLRGDRRELEGLINGHAMESGSDTPDWILAEYLTGCLTAFDAAVTKRERWYGRAPQEADAAVSAELDGEP